MGREEEIKEINDLFGFWAYKIKTRNCNDFYDINSVAEGIVKDLLNEIFDYKDYKLVILDDEKRNFPGIDLGDRDKGKIAFQITSTTDKKNIKNKVKDALTIFVKKKHDKIYPNGIRFLFLTFDAIDFGNANYTDIYPNFDLKNHILTFKNLAREIKKVYNDNPVKIERIKKILKNEILILDKKSKRSFTKSFLWANLPKSEELPSILKPAIDFVGRKKEIEELENKLKPNHVILIVGPSNSGKSALFKVYLNRVLIAGKKDKSFSLPLSLLYLTPNEKFGDECVLRSLQDALKDHYESEEKSMDNLIGDEFISEYDEEENNGSASDKFLSSLYSIIHRRSLITVIEDCQILLSRQNALKTLELLLSHDVFEHGSAILISREENLPKISEKRIFRSPLLVKGLIPSEAEILLKNIVENEEIAHKAIEELREFDIEFYPFGVKRGGYNFVDSVDEDKSKNTGEFLSECIFDAIEPKIKDVLSQLQCDKLVNEDGSAGPLAFLMAFALLCNSRITNEILQKLKLFSSVGIALRQLGWIAEESDNEYPFEMSQHKLKTMLIEHLTQKDNDEMKKVITNAAIELIDIFKSNVSLIDEETIKLWFDNALAFLDESIQNKDSLWYRLFNELLQLSSSDTIFPISTERYRQMQEEHKYLEIDPLLKILSDLVICVRDKNRDGKFIEKLSQAIDLYMKKNTIEGYELGKLDKFGFLGTKYIREKNKILKLRESLLEHFKKYPNVLLPKSAEFTKWKISWILNTLAIKIRLGDLKGKEVDELFSDCHQNLAYYKEAESTDYPSFLWLKSRLNLLESRYISDKILRLEKIRDAFDYVLTLYRLSEGDGKWLSYLFRISRYLLIEENEDNYREDTLIIIRRSIQSYLGDIENWPIHVSVKFASLYRLSSRCMISQEKSINHIDFALKILTKIERNLKYFIEIQDNRPLLALARCFITKYKIYENTKNDINKNNTFNKAKNLCQFVIDQCPTPSAWELALELSKLYYNNEFLYYRSGYFPKNTDSSYFNEVTNKCRNWIEKSKCEGYIKANLLVLCDKMDWSKEGGIERAAREFPKNKDWTSLPGDEKLDIIKKFYARRSSKLSKIKKEYGPSIKIFLADLINLGQYQHSIARYTDRVMNIEKIKNLSEEYLLIWPMHPIILEEMGKLYRKIWDYPKAIQFFDQVLKSTNDGIQRREVSVILSETLLESAIHFKNTEFFKSKSFNRIELLTWAKTLLESLEGNKIAAVKAAIIKDRVNLELGEYLDWENLEKSYNDVFGGPERYLETVIKRISDSNFDFDMNLPQSVAEAVMKNFTSTDAFLEMGKLFLRRAEIGKSYEPVMDCERAYSVFNACRILYESFPGYEPSINKFLRAKAIQTAAEFTKSPNPFQADCGRKRYLLHLAHAQMQSARGNAIGRFYKLTGEKIAEIEALRSEIGGF